MYDDSYTYTPLGSAIYWSLGRVFFALSMAVLIFGMAHNISGCKNKFILNFKS